MNRYVQPQSALRMAGPTARPEGDVQPRPAFRHAPRNSRRPARGAVLLEATFSMVILSVVGLAMLKMSLNIVAPRQWTLQQSLTDAYLTYERAFAQREPFERITATDSPWPAFPAKSEVTVELGKLPGGRPLTATLVRTRRPDPNNLAAAGGSGTITTNPAAMEMWRLQSLVSYQIGGRTYVKSRTVVRTR